MLCSLCEIVPLLTDSIAFPSRPAQCNAATCNAATFNPIWEYHSTRYSTATTKVRKQCFEAFWYTHHLAFFFMLALFSHATGCFVRDSPDPDFKKSFPFYNTRHCLGYESWRFTIWPFVLYFGERILREVRARKFTRLEKVLVHPSGTP